MLYPEVEVEGVKGNAKMLYVLVAFSFSDEISGSGRERPHSKRTLGSA